MQKIEYDLPVFKDEDIADLNEYSKQMANAIKVQIDKFRKSFNIQRICRKYRKLTKYSRCSKWLYLYGKKRKEKLYL